MIFLSFLGINILGILENHAFFVCDFIEAEASLNLLILRTLRNVEILNNLELFPSVLQTY